MEDSGDTEREEEGKEEEKITKQKPTEIVGAQNPSYSFLSNTNDQTR